MTKKSADKDDLVMTWIETRTHLEEALPEVTRLMEKKFDQLHGNPEPGSALDQRGLNDGAKIVSDYITQNELGIALEHLCYMVEEANLLISARTYALLEAAEQSLQTDVPALRRIKPPTN